MPPLQLVQLSSWRQVASTSLQPPPSTQSSEQSFPLPSVRCLIPRDCNINQLTFTWFFFEDYNIRPLMFNLPVRHNVEVPEDLGLICIIQNPLWRMLVPVVTDLTRTFYIVTSVGVVIIISARRLIHALIGGSFLSKSSVESVGSEMIKRTLPVCWDDPSHPNTLRNVLVSTFQGGGETN